MGKHRHVPVEIRYAAILFLKRQFVGDVGHAGRKHRQMKLGHGTVSPDEGKKRTELPSPSHHPRILSIRPRSARRHPAFLVGRIDLANNFTITPLQSHPSEIRRSDLRAYDSVGDARASIGRYLGFYNSRRPHSSLDGVTPDQAYFNSLPLRSAA